MLKTKDLSKSKTTFTAQNTARGRPDVVRVRQTWPNIAERHHAE